MTYLAWTVSFDSYRFFETTILTIIIAGAKKKCEQIGVNLLGDIPLHPQICSDADTGKPTVVANPEAPQAQAFSKIAQELISKLNLN